jgi:transcriptional regulator with XRE-family HTH domain
MNRKTTKKNGRPKPYIQKLRELTGISQDKAAELSGVSKRMIQTLENYTTGTSENIEALLTVYFTRLDPEKNKELIG